MVYYSLGVVYTMIIVYIVEIYKKVSCSSINTERCWSLSDLVSCYEKSFIIR